MIDAVRLTTHIHRDPAAAGYGAIVARAAPERLVPQAAPALAVALAELDLGP